MAPVAPGGDTTIRPVDAAYAWTAADVADPSTWTLLLDDQQVSDVIAAVRDAQCHELALPQIDALRYPLPSLRRTVERIRADLRDGRGFTLLRGLPVFDLSVEESELACWLIGSHVATPVPQNAAGAGLIHVRDQGLDFDDPEVFGYQSRNRLDFHVDSSDVVALLCRRVARSGGASRIVSSAAVHNELLRRYPDLVAELYVSFAWDRRLPIEARPGFFRSPVFSDCDGRLSTRYGRSYLESAQRHGDAPRLTASQVAALDAFDELTNSPGLFFDMVFRAGDMQFLNNYSILHARTEYVDHPEPDLKRDLVRLWLTLPDYHALAPEFAAAGLTRRDTILPA